MEGKISFSLGLAASPKRNEFGSGTFGLTALDSYSSGMRPSLVPSMPGNWEGANYHSPFLIFEDADDDEIRELELERMQLAEAEQCCVDRFWGLDREYWDQRRALKGMYAEDVASWRLREAEKIQRTQNAWEREDMESRKDQAYQLGRFEQAVREDYLQYFYQSDNSASIAQYQWPSRPKLDQRLAKMKVTREDYGLTNSYPRAQSVQSRRKGMNAAVNGSGIAGLKRNAHHLFHVGLASARHVLFRDKLDTFEETLAQRQSMYRTGVHSSSVSLRSALLSASIKGPKSTVPESEESFPDPQSSNSKVVLAPLLEGGSSITTKSSLKKKKKKPEGPDQAPQVLIFPNNQMSSRNILQRPSSQSNSTNYTAAFDAEDSQPQLRPHTADSSTHSSPSQFVNAREVMQVPSDSMSSKVKTPHTLPKKTVFKSIEVYQPSLVLPDNEDEFLTRSFEIIDIQRRGYITEDELLFGIQENVYARTELKKTVLWAIVKKKNWSLFGEMFSSLGNADLQVYLNFAHRMRVQRNIPLQFIRPADNNNSEQRQTNRVSPLTFQEQEAVDFLLLRGPIWYRARILVVNNDGTFDVECLNQSQAQELTDNSQDGDTSAETYGQEGFSFEEVTKSKSNKDESYLLSLFFSEYANENGYLNPRRVLQIIGSKEAFRSLHNVPSLLALHLYSPLQTVLISAAASSKGLTEVEFVEVCSAFSEIVQMNGLLRS